MQRRLLLTAALLALAMGCGPQAENSQRDAAKQASAQDNRPALADLCAVAQHPERYDGQRVRLRAIVVPNVESTNLTSPACMRRRWDGAVGIDGRRTWDRSGIGAATVDAARGSTLSRPLAAQAEFEGIVHVRARPAPVNARDFGPMPPFVAMLKVVKIDHARVVAVPAS